MKYAISVVVIGINEEKLVGKCFNSLVGQEFDRSFEVIFVDGGSKDRTVEIVRRYSKNFPLRISGQMGSTIGDARETGFRLAKAKIIASTDSDVILPSDWLATIYNHFRSSQAAGVVGPYTSATTPKFWQIVIILFCRFIDMVGGTICGFQPFRGMNFAIRRDAWLDAGGFSRKISAMEDADLAFKVSKFGKIDYLPDLVVSTTLRRFKKNLVRGTIYRLLAFYTRIYRRDYSRYTKWQQIRE